MGWFFTWPGIMVPMNLVNVWITWAYLEFMYGDGQVYCWEEFHEVYGLHYICNVYGNF